MNNQQKFPEVVVAEASAGSGKTYALAKRYLQLLINPYLKLEDIPLNTILAITFTNKATIEMKERILELLKKISLGAFTNVEEEKDILNALGVDKNFAKEKAGLIMEEFIRHYNSFQVQTIDSFINALLVGCALNIERSANFKIKRDYFEYLAYCLDLVIEQAEHKKEVFDFLDDFLRHYLLVENRRGWFPKKDILLLMQSLFQLSNKYGRFFQTYKGQSSEVIKGKKYVYKLICELSENFPEGFNANTQKSIMSFIGKSDDIFDIGQLPLAFKGAEAPMNKEKSAPADFEKKWEKIHKELIGLLTLDATVVYTPYIKLFRSLSEFFQAVSKKEDVLFLEELNKKARLLFDETGLSLSEVYYRLATRFKHYLIDEFQDTSVLQWQNLAAMVEDALSSGGSLFYVGDKKQAIYRFRGGEAKLFDEVREEFLRYNVIPTHLTKNFRSSQAIIDFNNKVFSKDNLSKMLFASKINEELGNSKKAMDEVMEIFKDAIQVGHKENLPGYVYVERIDEANHQDNKAVIQSKLLSLIAKLHQRFDYQDMAILTRDNAEVERISSWLLCENIAVESEKTLNVIENDLIREVIAFLNFLYSPIDDLNFAVFIMGKIFCAVSKIPNREICDFIFSTHKEKRQRQNISLYHLFRNKYPEIWQSYFNDFFKNIGFISTYELLISIYGRFKVYEHFNDQQAFFMKFLELVKEKEEDCTGVGEFLDYLKNPSADDLYVNATHSDSVKVLTIHKSKGLEFPVVIIPFLRMDINPETAGKGSNSYVTYNPDNALGLVRITKVHRDYCPLLEEIYAQNYKKACIDELNNVYVALTRPKYELYLFLPKKSAGANNKALFLIPEELKELGKQASYPDLKQNIQQGLIEIPASNYKDWIESVKIEFADSLSVIQREQVLEGNIMHCILSRISNCLEKNIKEIVSGALDFAKAKYPFIHNFLPYEEKIHRLLAKEELKPIFNVAQGQIFCEKEIVNHLGELKRIDRLILTAKEAWVIDYKSSQQAKDLQIKQVLEYLDLIKELYPQHKVKGFLIYLDEMKMEQM